MGTLLPQLLAPLYENTESYCSHFDVGVGWHHILNIYIQVFYVMGKALSGELSCMGTGLVLHPFLVLLMVSPQFY